MVMAEIGGHLAHQLPLHNHNHNHNQTGLQPSLVMNHHLDLDCHGHDVISEYGLLGGYSGRGYYSIIGFLG